ncbi:MAG: glycosyltransferase family 39 protein [Ignavibacteriaceae bacterium]|nr:glycosyltransferase family 39 protein [Ignavibacteriaceae bacterium]
MFISEGKTPNNFFWPVNYPLAGAILSFITINNILSLQLISLVSFLFAIFYVKRILRLIFVESQENILLYISIAFAVSPIMLVYSQLVMSDMLCLFFITAGFYHSVKFEKEFQNKDYLFAVMFMAAAVCTRYVSIVILIFPAVLIIKVFVKNFQIKTLIFSLLIAAIILLPEVILKFNYRFDFLNNVWLKNWNLLNFIGASFNTPEGYFNYRFPNIIYAFENLFHPAFIFMGIVLIPFIRKSDFEIRVVKQSIIIIILYVIFIAGIPFQNLRFLLLTFPFVIILMYTPFLRLNSYLKHPLIKKLLILSVAVIQLFFYGYMFNTIYKQNKLEREISDYLKGFPGRFIYTFSIDPALRSYNVKNRIINLWSEKVTDYRDSSFLLFNKEKFEQQWQGKNPMINWNYFKDNYSSNKIKQFEDGWELYELN